MIDNTCCCGVSLQRGARVIGIIDVILAFASLFCLIFSDKLTEWVNRLLEDDNNNPPSPPVSDYDISLPKIYRAIHGGEGDGDDGGTETLIIIGLVMAYTTLDICASSLLFHGSSNKSKISCRWWFRMRVFLLMNFIIYFFVEMNRSSLFLYGVIDILIIFYRMYCLSTIHNFEQWLEREEELAARRRRSIVIPYVQVITPEGSYSALFPYVGDTTFPQFNGGEINRIFHEDQLLSPSPTHCLLSDD